MNDRTDEMNASMPAKRAAEAIMRQINREQSHVDQLASIIERETRVGELAAALREFLEGYGDPRINAKSAEWESRVRELLDRRAGQ